MGISIYRWPCGTPAGYQVQYKLPSDSKRRFKTFRRRPEAEAFLKEAKALSFLERSQQKARALEEALADPARAVLTGERVADVLYWHALNRDKASLTALLPRLTRDVGDARVAQLDDAWTRSFCQTMMKTPNGLPDGGFYSRETIAISLSTIWTALKRRAAHHGVHALPGPILDHLPKRATKLRQRRLRGDEHARIRQALGRIGESKKDDPDSLMPAVPFGVGRHYQLLFDFAIETCAAPAEMAELPWTEIDMASASWRLPARRSRTKRRQSIQLTARAAQILRELADDRNGSDLVFHRLPKLESIQSQWRIVMTRIGVADLRLSDLRYEGLARRAGNPNLDFYEFFRAVGRSDKTLRRYAHLRSPEFHARFAAEEEALALGAAVPAVSADGPTDSGTQRLAGRSSQSGRL